MALRGRRSLTLACNNAERLFICAAHIGDWRVAAVLGFAAVFPAAPPPANGLMVSSQRDPERRCWPAGGLVVGAQGRETGIEHPDLVAGAPAVDIGFEHRRRGLVRGWRGSIGSIMQAGGTSELAAIGPLLLEPDHTPFAMTWEAQRGSRGARPRSDARP